MFPILFTESELKFLKGTNISILIQNKLTIWQSIHEYMKSSFPDAFTFSLEEYLIGNVLYESRGFCANEYEVAEE
jgi:hypothetical protein